MKETLTFVTLKCLNCGANLKITESLFEFACQYCGASQIVQREGGIVALKFFSDKIDQVQNTVNQTAAELKIQRLTKELEELEEKHSKLDETRRQMKSLINPIFSAVSFVAVFASIVLASYTESTITWFFCVAGILFVIWFWRRKINEINADFEEVSKPMYEKGIIIERKIADLKKIVEL